MAADRADEVIGVLVVDDHRLVRAGLVRLIDAEADMQVVGQAGDGAQAVEVAATSAPDVVLMDLSMPVLDGVAATRAILAAKPETAVVVLTSFAESERVMAALRAGAVGYLLKDSEPAALLAGVRSAAAGNAPVDARVARALLPAAATANPLSDREEQVLRLVGSGLANKQIGRQLGIAERTVKAHLSNVFRAIGVTDRASAALWARDHLTSVVAQGHGAQWTP